MALSLKIYILINLHTKTYNLGKLGIGYGGTASISFPQPSSQTGTGKLYMLIVSMVKDPILGHTFLSRSVIGSFMFLVLINYLVTAALVLKNSL
jgi:hypothetical protein